LKRRSYEDVKNMENRRDSIGIAGKKYPYSVFPKSRRSLTEPSIRLAFVLRETENGKMRVTNGAVSFTNTTLFSFFECNIII